MVRGHLRRSQGNLAGIDLFLEANHALDDAVVSLLIGQVKFTEELMVFKEGFALGYVVGGVGVKLGSPIHSG